MRFLHQRVRDAEGWESIYSSVTVPSTMEPPTKAGEYCAYYAVIASREVIERD